MFLALGRRPARRQPAQQAPLNPGAAAKRSGRGALLRATQTPGVRTGSHPGLVLSNVGAAHRSENPGRPPLRSV